jgi:hypothetical protein
MCLIQNWWKYSSVGRDADLCYGLSTRDAGRFRYQCAVKCKFEFPNKWHETEVAGIDSLNAFLKITSHQSIRRPDAAKFARAMNFSRATVNAFFSVFLCFLLKINWSRAMCITSMEH